MVHSSETPHVTPRTRSHLRTGFVLAAVGSDPTSIDQVVARSGLPVPRVLSTISVLEMRRLLRRLSGTTVVRV